MSYPHAADQWLDGVPHEAAPPAVDACAEWLPGLRVGDEAAARAVMEILFPTVLKIIRSHLPPNMDENDLAQEVFLRVFTKVDQYRAEKPFSHWVSRITTNVCLDALRRQKVRPEVRMADLTDEEARYFEQLQDFAFHEENQQVDAEQEEIQDRLSLVEKFLGTLKPDQQLVLRLLDLEQLSVKDICNQTGWGASKVKVTAMRARQKLTALIANLGKHLRP